MSLGREGEPRQSLDIEGSAPFLTAIDCPYSVEPVWASYDFSRKIRTAFPPITASAAF